MEKISKDGVAAFLLRSALFHSLSYLAAGMLASSLLDYRGFFEAPVIRDYMLPFGSSAVSAGPWLQPLRGLLFGLVLLPFRAFLAERRLGWLQLWGLFLGLGILGTPAAAPSSLEGLIYSRLPLWYHLAGLPEICLQTLAYSCLLHLSLRRPEGLLRDLPPVLGSLLAALAAACFAFVGYAAFSLLFALASGADLGNLEGSMSLRTQGLFLAPLLLNGALVFLAGRSGGRLRPPLVFGFSYASNALAIALYQALVLGGASPAYFLLAPLLPALIVALSLRSLRKPAGKP